MGIFLNGEESGFKTTVEALWCQPNLSLSTLREKLMDAEARSFQDEPSGRALPVHGSRSTRGGRKESRTCFKCGKQGHLKKDCPDAQKQAGNMHQPSGRCLAVSDDTH
jgi:hypothetical protein